VTNEALLAAVIAAPEDDTPRLVYADWFEENDQPERAEFIRVQVERARLPLDDPRHGPLVARELRLLAEYGKEWAAGIPTLDVVRFRRGFVECVAADGVALTDHAEELFRRHPIRELRVCGMERVGGAALAARPELARVEHLRIDDFRGAPNLIEETQTLLRSEHWRVVTGLTLITTFGPDPLREVMRHPGFSGLRALHINGIRADDFAAVVAEFPDVPLESCWINPGHMGICSFSGAGFRRLAESPHWPRLRELDTGVSPWGHDWADLSETLPRSRLRALRLRVTYPNAGTGTVDSFLRAASWGEVESLMVDDFYLELSRLLDHPSAKQLRELGIPRLHPVDADRVLTCANLRGLRKLVTNFACEPGALATPEAAPMAGLRELLIGVGNSAGALAGSPHLGRLRTLEVGVATEDAARTLFASTALPSLTRLVVRGRPDLRLGPETVQTLTGNRALGNLSSAVLLCAGWDRANLGPLIENRDLAWLEVHPDFITDDETRQRFQARQAAVGGHVPPLDEIDEPAWFPDV
jgi:uncharacterized protein (TIGR02996 family)